MPIEAPIGHNIREDIRQHVSKSQSSKMNQDEPR